jgi:hypothetical protein
MFRVVTMAAVAAMTIAIAVPARSEDKLSREPTELQRIVRARMATAAAMKALYQAEHPTAQAQDNRGTPVLENVRQPAVPPSKAVVPGQLQAPRPHTSTSLVDLSQLPPG